MAIKIGCEPLWQLKLDARTFPWQLKLNAILAAGRETRGKLACCYWMLDVGRVVARRWALDVGRVVATVWPFLLDVRPLASQNEALAAGCEALAMGDEALVAGREGSREARSLGAWDLSAWLRG